MKQLNKWVKAHPYKAIGFVFFFTLCAATMAIVNERGFWCGMAIYGIMINFWVMIFLLDIPKLPIVLAIALATSSAKAADPPDVSPGVVVGIVVVCVGGYCVYKVVKFCQRKFPKETTSNTNNSSFFPTTGDGESAASWNYGAIGSCDPTLTPGPDLVALETAGTLFAVNVRIDDDGNAVVGTSALGEAATQNWTDFQSEVARHGVYITGSPDGSQYFSTNRVPCNSGCVPISFDASTKTVDLNDNDGTVKLIEIERSRDLRNWSPFLRTTIRSGGHGLRVEDATTAVSMFYRVKVSNP